MGGIECVPRERQVVVQTDVGSGVALHLGVERDRERRGVKRRQAAQQAYPVADGNIPGKIAAAEAAGDNKVEDNDQHSYKSKNKNKNNIKKKEQEHEHATETRTETREQRQNTNKDKDEESRAGVVAQPRVNYRLER